MLKDINEVYWFPMRVAYHHELRIRDELLKLNIEHYLPLKWELRTYGDNMRRLLVPALNIIFIRSRKEDITKMKMYNKELTYLRYIKNTFSSTNKQDTDSDITIVPDCEMNSFMLATNQGEEQPQYLRYTDFLEKEGRKVRVIKGNFVGVEGKIKRIQRDRCVVVCLRGIAAVAIHVPFNQLQFLDGK